jgi:diguanylate cyclase (GGDEF)-like protein
MTMRRRGRTTARASLGSPLYASAALVVVLVAVAYLVATSNMKVSGALQDQRRALAVDSAFGDARLAVATEVLAVRNFRVEPSSANLFRVDESLSAATTSVHEALNVAGIGSESDAVRLETEQATLVLAAKKMSRLALAGLDDARRVADMEVAPAYYVLQADLDHTAGEFHARSQSRLAELQQVHRRTLAAQAVAGAIAAVVLVVVLRLLLLYQRRLHRQARRHERAAMHDSLTGLPNAAYFGGTLQGVLDDLIDPSRTSAGVAAVALIDLDDFKAINDTFGHQAGDTVLVAVSEVLRSCVGPDDLVSRLGGDEFAVILRDQPNPAAVQRWALAAAAALRCDVEVREGPVAVSGSVGVSVIEETDHAAAVLHRADLAMYHAKASLGPGAWMIDSDQPVTRAVEAPAQVLTELRQLIDSHDPDNQLELHYQPQVRCSDGIVCGVEALVRWRHPSRGLLQPAAFLSVALTPALQLGFSNLVLARAVSQLPHVLETVDASGMASSSLAMAVNVTASALAGGGVAEPLAGLMDAARLASHQLRVEISQLDEPLDVTALESSAGALHRSGVGLTIDNFGMGTGELDILRRIPVDELKIDRSFVIGKRGAPPDERILRASAALARGLGVRAAAQGAESAAACQMLKRVGFDVVQGHHLARPMPLYELGAELERLRSTWSAIEADVVDERPDSSLAGIPR